MKSDPASLLIAFMLGCAIAVGYLAMLWYSVRGLTDARHPVARLLGGALIRLGLLIGAFYLVMDGRWERLLACLAGFIVVRIAVTRLVDRHDAPGGRG